MSDMISMYKRCLIRPH